MASIETMRAAELARQCMDNPFFQNVIQIQIDELNNVLNSLGPNDTDKFVVVRSQQMLLSNLIATFRGAAAQVEVEKEQEANAGKGVL